MTMETKMTLKEEYAFLQKIKRGAEIRMKDIELLIYQQERDRMETLQTVLGNGDEYKGQVKMILLRKRYEEALIIKTFGKLYRYISEEGPSTDVQIKVELVLPYKHKGEKTVFYYYDDLLKFYEDNIPAKLREARIDEILAD